MRSKLSKYGKRTAIAALVLFLLFIILNWFFPLKLNIDYSTIVEDSKGNTLYAFLNKNDKWRMKTELSEISPVLRKAIIYKEDKYFYHHPGINPFAMVRAAFNNVFHARRTSGASTITMQVARMLDHRNRTYINKVIEIFRALQLEWNFSKEEILQLYINLLPYGGNIEGMKSASLIYFQKAPQQLSLAEVTTLAIIPNKPTSLGTARNTNALIAERNKWLERFDAEKIFPQQEIKDALTEPVELIRHDVPREAPHFCLRMKQEYHDESIIKTNLNRDKQLTAEKIVRNAVSKLKMMNINNAAILVINNQTKQVEAYVGSSDFNDASDGGQVDGVQAIRSPGSTLKPLLYATAFDKGLLTPKTRINDVPVNVAGYFPVNYDQQFNGSVTVEYALVNSLNIPAIKTLNDVGVKDFIAKLKTAQFNSVARNEKGLGLSLILGGCGVTLEQLVDMYSSFANGGYYSKINWIKNNNDTNKLQLISPQSAYMVTDILSQMHRPDLPYNFQNTTHLPRVAWKTGTSYGRRDAWSIGFNTKYTIGVWVGNFSGKGVPELNGAEIATPLLFELFNTIDYNSSGNWFVAPKGIDYRLVCSESGKVPDDFCDSKVMDMYIPMVSSNEKCDHKKNIFVSDDEKISYCTSCLPLQGYKRKLVNNYAPELLAWMEENKIIHEKLPPHNPNCERIFSDGKPYITSPINNMDFFIDQADTQKILLSCHAAMEVEKIYWFVNDKLYASCKPDERLFFQPATGKTKISCADDKGRSNSVWINVKGLH
ncbi:MAG: penicillin-binding protein 1C [Bacteroidia bacterium]